MNLVLRASLNRIRAEFGQERLSTFGNTAVQPSASSAPNTIEKQMSGVSARDGELSAESMKQVKMYRAYKKTKAKQDRKERENSSDIPLLPNTLKNSIKRAKTIKQDDIAPSI